MKNMLSISLAVFCVLCQCARAETDESQIRKKIDLIAKSKDATIGAAFLIDGRMFKYNDGHRFPLMSVFKFHVTLAALKEMERGRTGLDEQMRIRSAQMDENTYSPLREKHPNRDFSISYGDLMRYCISQSDNNACDILIEYAGGISEVDRLAKRLGVENLSLSETEKSMHADMSKCYGNWGAPSSVVELMQLAYGGNLLTKEHRGFLENIMKETSTGADKIKAGLPENVVLGHKTGSSDRTGNGVKIADNDAGVIYLPGGRKCFLAIFVKDSKESDETNARIISDIAKVIYNALSN